MNLAGYASSEYVIMVQITTKDGAGPTTILVTNGYLHVKKHGCSD